MGEGKTIIVTVSWKLLNEAAVKEIFICFDSRVHEWLHLDFRNAKVISLLYYWAYVVIYV